MAVSKDINSIIDEYLDLNNEFGFVTSDKVVDEDNQSIQDYKERLNQIEQLIMPLLANLHGTAKDDYIYWPNRKEPLEQKIKEFLKLTRGTTV